MRPAHDPPASSAADSPEMTLRLAGDHDQIAGRLNDIVAHRLFSAGLALEAALGLIGGHRAAGKIQHAVSELHLAIRDIRDMVFDPGRSRVACCPAGVSVISVSGGREQPARRVC